MKKLLLIVAALAALALTSPPARGQDVFDWVKEEDVKLVEALLTGSTKFGPLIEAAFGAKLVADVADWSERAQKAIAEGAAIPAPPANFRGTNTLLKNVSRVRDLLKSLEPKKDVDFEFPSLDSILADGEQGAQALAQCAEAVRRMGEHRRAAEVATRVLDEYATRADAVVRALNTLSRELQALAPKVVFKPYMDALGFAILDIETQYRPAAAEVRTSAMHRAKQFRAELERRATEFDNARHNVRLLLEGRRSAAQERSTVITDQIEAMNAELQKAREELVRRAEDLQRRQKELQARAEKHASDAKTHNASIDHYNRDVSSLKSLEKRIKGHQYTGCPNGESFSNCTHNAQKAAYVKKHNEMVADYNRGAKRLQDVGRSISQRGSQLKAQEGSLDGLASKFRADAHQFESDAKGLDAREGEAATKLKEFVAELWSLRGQISTVERALAVLDQSS